MKNKENEKLNKKIKDLKDYIYLNHNPKTVFDVEILSTEIKINKDDLNIDFDLEIRTSDYESYLNIQIKKEKFNNLTLKDLYNQIIDEVNKYDANY